jgi:hypothetical protein
MPYLIKNPDVPSRKKRAHIWKPKVNDTACRQYSTGGMKRLHKFRVVEDRGNVQICSMCAASELRNSSDEGTVIWDD